MPGQTSHHLRVDRDTVTKTFRFWGCGEPDREWDGLTVLAEHAPGLAPVPVRCEIRDGAPALVMTRVPGVELGGASLTEDETRALGAALGRLFDVPATALTGLPDRIWGASSGLEQLRTRAGEADDAPCAAAKAVDAARACVDRCTDYRRLFAIYWLMLLPDGPAHHRNPPGSLADQSAHVLRLLDEEGPSR